MLFFALVAASVAAGYDITIPGNSSPLTLTNPLPVSGSGSCTVNAAGVAQGAPLSIRVDMKSGSMSLGGQNLGSTFSTTNGKTICGSASGGASGSIYNTTPGTPAITLSCNLGGGCGGGGSSGGLMGDLESGIGSLFGRLSADAASSMSRGVIFAAVTVVGVIVGLAAMFVTSKHNTYGPVAQEETPLAV